MEHIDTLYDLVIAALLCNRHNFHLTSKPLLLMDFFIVSNICSYVQISTFTYNRLVTTIPVSRARASLREVLERVKQGDEVVLTQHGEPVAVLVHPAQLRARHAAPSLEAASRRLEGLEEARERRPDRGPGLARVSPLLS